MKINHIIFNSFGVRIICRPRKCLGLMWLKILGKDDKLENLKCQAYIGWKVDERFVSV